MTLPDLTPAERIVFTAIYAAPDCYVAELERLTELESSRVARAVLKLERKGLIVTALRHVPRRERVPAHTRRHCRPADWTVRG